ncbi:hypothetical protein Tco_1145208, partial [Tanacetum coccineum]
DLLDLLGFCGLDTDSKTCLVVPLLFSWDKLLCELLSFVLGFMCQDNDDPVAMEVQSPLVDQTNVGKTGGGSYPPLPTQGTTPAGNTPGKSSYANVIGELSKKAVNIRTIFTSGVAYPVVANYVRNTWGKFGFVKSMLNSSNELFFFQFSSTDGLNLMLENEDVGNVSVWVKLHSVHVTVFSEDGLSAIALKLGTLLMLDSYTYDMCLQSWGRSSYTRVMVNLWAGVELKDTIMEECPKNIGLGVTKNFKKPSQTSRGVSVGPKVGFKPHKEYRHVPKNLTASSSGNKKIGVKPTNEVSNTNPFEVFNSVDSDVELGTNEETTNLVNNGSNSSGSFFMNVENSSTSNTPIIDKIKKFEDLLISGQAILVNEAGNPLKKVECPGDYDSEYEVASVDNDMARSMALERVEFGTQSQDLSQEIQAICDNLDIRIRGRKKK